MSLVHRTKTVLATGLASQAAADDLLGDLEAFSALKLTVIDEVVALTNAVETNLSKTVPAGAVILSVQGNLNTAIAGDGTGVTPIAKVGIGVTADPDKYGKTSALTKNSKVSTIPAHAVLAAAEQICVKGTDAAGAASDEKFVVGEKVRVRVVYAAPEDLPNV